MNQDHHIMLTNKISKLVQKFKYEAIVQYIELVKANIRENYHKTTKSIRGSYSIKQSTYNLFSHQISQLKSSFPDDDNNIFLQINHNRYRNIYDSCNYLDKKILDVVTLCFSEICGFKGNDDIMFTLLEYATSIEIKQQSSQNNIKPNLVEICPDCGMSNICFGYNIVNKLICMSEECKYLKLTFGQETEIQNTCQYNNYSQPYYSQPYRYYDHLTKKCSSNEYDHYNYYRTREYSSDEDEYYHYLRANGCYVNKK